ncbi:hypothetical protein ACR9GP_24360 [Enterobacter ludwigii]
MNEDIASANVFGPDGKLEHFENYLHDYLADRRRADNVSLDHKALSNMLSAIRLARKDGPALLPVDPAEAFWWEVCRFAEDVLR